MGAIISSDGEFMKSWRKMLCWMACSVVLLALVVSALALLSMRPTTGPRIGSYPASRTALVVVDIQEDYTGPKAKKRYRDGDRIVEVANLLLAQAQTKGAVIVFVKNVFDNPVMSVFTGGLNAPGSPGTEMDGRLIKVPAMTFSKGRSDAFSNPELDAYLRKSQVDRLLLVGLDGAYCVDATARGALNRGYKVTLFQQGIATESGKSMEELAQGWREAGAEVEAGTKM